MRALLIDPEARTITELQLAGDPDAICAALGCEHFEGGPSLTGSFAEGGDTLYGDSNGLFVNDYEEDADGKVIKGGARFFFQLDADRDPPTSHPTPGKAVVLGFDKEGGSCDAQISLADLVARVTFTERKFRGTRTVRTRDGIRVELDAPIIDKE